ncbi:MAG TPA: polysaccharide deacetylase family protein [Candidatus Saccharimonadales bacterium]|nr:polysaccharide deacetylase family protein [Candidatus Saccharimonadales bacterium]
MVSPKKSAQGNGRKLKRANKFVLSAIAICVTLLPILSVGVWVKNTFFADQRHTITLQTLQPEPGEVRLFDEPMISVTFDDGWESVYSKGAPILDKHGIRTTQYVLSGSLDFLNYLSRDQIISLHRAGHDIQSHTVSHNDLTSLNHEELEFELKESRDAISKLVGKEVKDFASPLNRQNQEVINEIQKYYRSHRNTDADIDTLYDGSFNMRSNFNPYQISAFSIRRTTTVDQIIRFIEAAKEKNAWIILIYHQIEDESEDYYAVTPKQLDEQMATIKDSQIRIVTMEEALNAYDKQKAQ